MTTNSKTILLDAALMLEKHAWCQGRYAKTAEGDATFPSDPEAVAWCGRGALLLTCMKATGGNGYGEVFQGALEAISALGIDLVVYNDTNKRTKEEVIDVLRRAASVLEEKT